MLQAIHQEFHAAISKAHDALKRDLATVRAGRPTAALLDGIRVDCYGTLAPIHQMAHVHVPDARTMTVKPFDKQQLKSIEKAIRESDFGLHPTIEGDLVRIALPLLTGDRRKELVKIVKKYGEECKVTLRRGRHAALDQLQAFETEGKASRDDVERGRKKVEEQNAEAIKQVDVLVAHKEKEVLTI